MVTVEIDVNDWGLPDYMLIPVKLAAHHCLTIVDKGWLVAVVDVN